MPLLRRLLRMATNPAPATLPDYRIIAADALYFLRRIGGALTPTEVKSFTDVSDFLANVESGNLVIAEALPEMDNKA